MTEATEASAARAYYTPWQIFCVALFGGSAAGGYLFYRNYVLFGQPAKARTALAVGAVVFILLIALGFSLPDNSNSSGTVLAAAVAGMYRWYGEKAFRPEITRRGSQGWLPQSWWRVVGLSLAFLAGVIALILIAYLMLEANAV